jgi:sugar O-acyltransferase (sialic acid O-acetyltransferase NeuD family)
MTDKIILVGGFSEIIELCEDNDIRIVGIIEKSAENKIMGYPVLGTDDEASLICNDFKDVPIVISPDMPKVRKKLVEFYKGIGFSFQSLVSKKATISKYAKLGEGVIIHNGVNISAMTEIGSFVRVNVLGNVMHDCVVGSYSTIAPNSVLLGHVKVGEEVYIGANSTILPSIAIDNSAVIGAGAVVTKNVSTMQTVKGVPAK